MATGLIHSTDSFGTVDGPGIRFVVFTQQCEMRCLYCHNPDTWHRKDGKVITVDQLMKRIKSVRPYIKSGGVTVTGGEPLLQAKFVTELFRRCQEEGIHTCLDTNGFIKVINIASLDRLLGVTDLVMLDIKHADPGQHIKLTRVSQEPVLQFLSHLAAKEQTTRIRLVVLPGWTDSTEHMERYLALLKPHKQIEKIELLPYHELGRHKWEMLGMKYSLADVNKPEKKQMQLLAEKIRQHGYAVHY